MMFMCVLPVSGPLLSIDLALSSTLFSITPHPSIILIKTLNSISSLSSQVRETYRQHHKRRPTHHATDLSQPGVEVRARRGTETDATGHRGGGCH